jgi:membrane protease YdiL (CAAX protease family)
MIKDNIMNNKLKHTTIFFAISFTWTWIFYFLIILFSFNPFEGIGLIFLIFGGCSPTFVGIFMVLVTYNNIEKIDYLRRCYQIKHIRLHWWLLILLLFPAIYVLGILFNIILGGNMPEMINLRQIIMNPISLIPMLFVSFMSGPFAEELGWRGFALKPLLDRFGFTRASLLIGVIWSFWHLPLFFMPEMWHNQIGFTNIWAYLAQSIGLSMIMSFVFIRTNFSILSAILLHLTSNFTANLLIPFSDAVMITSFVLILIVGIIFCIYDSAKKNIIAKL